VTSCVDKSKVGRSFHNQATEYDHHTSVQKRVVKRLKSLVGSHFNGEPSTLLDVGCGTGQLLHALHEQFPHSRLYGLDLAYNMTQCAAERLAGAAQLVNADAESLPFKNGTFDLLLSTSTLQWLDNLNMFFQEAHRVSKPNGILCVAFFGGRTLCELRECMKEVVAQRFGHENRYSDRLHRFKERCDVENALESVDFHQATITSEIETEYYSDIHDLLRSIKRIGAGSSTKVSGESGLGWRGILNETGNLYQKRYSVDGKISATYEVLYVVARRRTI